VGFSLAVTLSSKGRRVAVSPPQFAYLGAFGGLGLHGRCQRLDICGRVENLAGLTAQSDLPEKTLLLKAND